MKKLKAIQRTKSELKELCEQTEKQTLKESISYAHLKIKTLASVIDGMKKQIGDLDNAIDVLTKKNIKKQNSTITIDGEKLVNCDIIPFIMGKTINKTIAKKMSGIGTHIQIN